MGRIRLMPDALAAQIAAGEVVERPASVVKELIENALDAGGEAIQVDLEAGGLRLIRVSDDGQGMDEEDACMAPRRHATSKVFESADLEEIHTLGFRGEALASILAVSRMKIQTCAADAELGTELAGSFGGVDAVRPVARTQGTTIEVAHLFRNTPARLEYLSSEAAETRRVVRVVQAAALGVPHVRFRMTSDGRELLALAAAQGLGERLRQVYGDDFVAGLLPLAAERDGVSVEGFMASPVNAKARSTRSAYFLNARPFESRAMRAVIHNATRAQTGGRHVDTVLYVRMDPRRFDPNVSPDKSAIRFRRCEGLLMATLTDALRRALADHAASGERSGRTSENAVWSAASDGEVEEAGGDETQGTLFVGSESAAVNRSRPQDTGVVGGARSRLPEEPAVLYQQARTFIVAPLDDGVLFLDQHSAHERVVYEDLVRGARERVQQPLLTPKPIEVSGAEDLLKLAEITPLLDRMGFSVEPSGPRGFWLTAVPGWLGQRDPARVIGRVVGEMDGVPTLGREGDEGRVYERLLHTVACHAAVRAGQTLSQEEMRALWRRVRTIDLGLLDVHGRPGALLVSNEELARRLGRGSLPGRRAA